MSHDLEALRSDYQRAEQAAQKLMADKDEALAKVHARYADRLRMANDKTSAAQKKLLDAEVVTALSDRPDGEKLARELVRQGGLSKAAVDEAFPAA